MARIGVNTLWTTLSTASMFATNEASEILALSIKIWAKGCEMDAR